MLLWDDVLKDLWEPLLKLEAGFKTGELRAQMSSSTSFHDLICSLVSSVTDCFAEGNGLCLELLSRATIALEARDWDVCRKAALEALEISYERLHR